MKSGHYDIVLLCMARDGNAWTVVTVLLASKPFLYPIQKGTWTSVGSGGFPALLLCCIAPPLSFCRAMPALPSWSLISLNLGLSPKVYRM